MASSETSYRVYTRDGLSDIWRVRRVSPVKNPTLRVHTGRTFWQGGDLNSFPTGRRATSILDEFDRYPLLCAHIFMFFSLIAAVTVSCFMPSSWCYLSLMHILKGNERYMQLSFVMMVS
jgi:hypothetical protein